MAPPRCTFELLLSETRSFGVARLSRLLHELATELELALRTGVCSEPLSLASVVIEHAGTREERARLPLTAAQAGSPELQPALREMGTLIEQLLQRLSLGVDASLMNFVNEQEAMKSEWLEKLGENKVLTLDDFADLSTAELLDILPSGSLNQEAAGNLIMAARASWDK